MTKIYDWQKKIMLHEVLMTNAQLLEAVLEQATGDDYDGCFTDRGRWEYMYLEEKLKERLAEWLK